MTNIIGNVYRHYKGKFYHVVGTVRDETTNDEAVLYVPLYKSPTPLFSRTFADFTDTIEPDMIPRFKFVCTIEEIAAKLGDMD